MKKVILSAISLLILSIAVWGQEVITVSGKVLDSNTKRPLGFASVYLNTTNISNVSNMDGIFSLKIPAANRNDTLLVSYLGYKSFKVAINSFNDRELTISLEPSSYNLELVVIKPQGAAAMVKTAITNIVKNYPAKAVQMTAFYREMIQKRNTYVSINEAVLDIDKASYRGYRADQIGIYKARGNYDENRVDTLLMRFQGGPNSALEIDIAKSPFLWTDLVDIDDVYAFRFEDPITINDRFFYVINFYKKPSNPNMYFRGKIYIDSETTAIGRVEFNMNVENDPRANALFIRKKPANLRMDVSSAKYIVNYRELGGLWYFDHSRTELIFNVKWEKKWFSSTYTITSELATTDILETTERSRIAIEDRVKQSDFISNKINDYTDDDFWEGYNIIEPEESIERVIDRIIRQLRRRN
jgi:hypothetical protein